MAMCPKCGIKIYLNSKTRHECPVHGEFKINYWNGELESVSKKNSKESLSFKRTFKDGRSYQRWHEVLDENTIQTEKDYRGSFGGGCSSPFKEKL
jgi:hypothetical protein